MVTVSVDRHHWCVLIRYNNDCLLVVDARYSATVEGIVDSLYRDSSV